MPLFHIDKNDVKAVRAEDFRSEKDLQRLIEHNLRSIFNCRFVATEFTTGAKHAGRIDTLALSEDGNPVIIEYKLTESATLINQGLFYLSWLEDHHGDFEVATRGALGQDVEIDWDEIRVLCVAPSFTKYDLHAVQTIGRQIELWTYKRFENGILQLEAAFGGASVEAIPKASGKNPIMVAAGKKAAATRALGGWTFQGHLEGKPQDIQTIIETVQEFLLAMDESIEEVPRKNYIAYRTTQNIVCLEPQKKQVLLWVKLDPKRVKGPEGISRDASEVGHYGTGDLEITVKTMDDFERAKPFLKQALEEAGG